MTDTRTPALSLALAAEALAEQATAVYRQARQAGRESLGDESLSAAGHGGLLAGRSTPTSCTSTSRRQPVRQRPCKPLKGWPLFRRRRGRPTPGTGATSSSRCATAPTLRPPP